MLWRSATFRRQCQRIADTPWLTVRIDRVAARLIHGSRARTDIVRGPSGALSAIVRLSPLEDDVELIAHEIEHVIEQLDGIDLASKAVWADSGVRASAGREPMFETLRATRMGLRVAQEVRKAGR